MWWQRVLTRLGWRCGLEEKERALVRKWDLLAQEMNQMTEQDERRAHHLAESIDDET
jgi:hypothetical protein